MALTDMQIRKAKPVEKPRKLSDGGGLYVEVAPSGSRLWRLGYRFDGKQKLLALGRYPDVGLAEARAKRDAARKLLADGIDPSHQAKLDRIREKTVRANTFGSIADELLVKDRREGKAPATLKKKTWLVDAVRPELGDRPVSEISAAEVLVPLRRIENAGTYEKAMRARGVIGEVFRYAIATARAENDPTFALRGALTKHQVSHRPAITEWRDFADQVRRVWSYPGSAVVRAALRLQVHLYPRPVELRFMEWEHIDFEKRSWVIPGKIAKMRREIEKPLSPPVVDLLREHQQLTGRGRLVFPGARSWTRPISENTLNGALRRLGYDQSQSTSHGFRASASTFLNESGLWREDVIEFELGHEERSDSRRPYNRAKYWNERQDMAVWWSGRIQSILEGESGP